MDIFLSRKGRQYTLGAFGFVRFQEPESASKAINKLNGVYMDGHRLKVASAYPHEPLKESTRNVKLIEVKKPPLNANSDHMKFHCDCPLNHS